MGMMNLLNIKVPAGVNTSAVAKKVKGAKRKVSVRKSTGNNLMDRINLIRDKVEHELGHLKDKFLCISTEEELSKYIDKCIENNLFSFDTETTSLDYINCELVGFSLFTPGMKACYCPVSHRSYVDNLLKENQLSLEIVNRQLKRLQHVPVYMHTGKFDINVIYYRFNWLFDNLVWDANVACKIYDERAISKLKYQYCIKIAKDGKVNDYSELFNGINFAYVPIKIAYLYGAKDAQITYELCEYQRNVYNQPGNEKLKELLETIEIPLVPVVASMQRCGVSLDIKKAEEFSVKYHKKLQEAEKVIDATMEMYRKDIAEYNKHNPRSQFRLPMNPNSNQQIAKFLYDVMDIKCPARENSRKTDKATLERIDEPICGAILEYKTISKLLSTYIDKLPTCVDPKTGKIHANFNQNGTDTGRFSSDDPNLQNIPSKNEEIRTMFVPSEGNVFIFADYSQQEPKATAWLSQDPNMLAIYASDPKADLYPEVASLAYHVPADECREFRPDGTVNKLGKERRGKAKIIQLAATYRQQASSLAKSLGCSVKEAKAIQDAYFNKFPRIEEFTEETWQFAYEHGYVETVWGRRRHLPNMQLEPYEFSWKDGVGDNFDLLDFDNETTVQEVPLGIQKEYEDQLDKCYGYRAKAKIIAAAAKENIKIIDNTTLISSAEREAINSPIQGTGSDMIKLSMVNLYNNKRFRELGGKIVLQIHDELGIECPEENAKEVCKIFQEVMETSPQVKIKLPWRCDMVVCKCWNGETIDV